MNRILVVDDSDRMNELAARLEGGKYSVRRSRNQESALKEIRRFKPHLILISAGSPGGDAFGAVRRFREQGETAEIPLIVLCPAELEERGFAAGASDCILEPVNLEAAAERISAAMVREKAKLERDELVSALKDRMAERTAELASLRKRLQLINDSKDLAIRLIVRELSAPATGIAGIARLALLEGKDGDKRERLLGLLNKNIETMDRLIANVEYLGTLKTGTSVKKRAPADMAPIAALAVERENARLTEKGLTVNLTFPGDRAILPLHPELFAQMMTPVLRLAIALSAPFAKVRIEAENCAEWSSFSVAWSSTETNQGIVASVIDFGSEILRSITGCGLVTEICLAEKIARIYEGTVVWDLRDAENASCTFQFDRSKNPQRNGPDRPIP